MTRDPSERIAIVLAIVQTVAIALRAFRIVAWPWAVIMIPLELSGAVYLTAFAKMLWLGLRRRA